MKQLPEVIQIGQATLPVAHRQHAAGEPLAGGDRLGEGSDAAVTQDPAPAVKSPVDLFPLLLGGGGHALGRPSEEWSEGNGSGPDGRGRALDRLEQPEPVPRRLGGKHVAAAVDDHRDPRGLQLVPDQLGGGVGAHQHRDVARTDQLVIDRQSIGRATLDLRGRGQ